MRHLAAFSPVTVLVPQSYLAYGLTCFCLFPERPQLCVSLECQQEETSHHGKAGSRLPW